MKVSPRFRKIMTIILIIIMIIIICNMQSMIIMIIVITSMIIIMTIPIMIIILLSSLIRVSALPSICSLLQLSTIPSTQNFYQQVKRYITCMFMFSTEDTIPSTCYQRVKRATFMFAIEVTIYNNFHIEEHYCSQFQVQRIAFFICKFQ